MSRGFFHLNGTQLIEARVSVAVGSYLTEGPPRHLRHPIVLSIFRKTEAIQRGKLRRPDQQHSRFLHSGKTRLA